ncbi:hypothetical protein [Ekhidna sp.]|uniref:hypothetical protein n=1 Tax=Ekhidna sp. TaxID=2608089 RepID=UPI003514A1DF
MSKYIFTLALIAFLGCKEESLSPDTLLQQMQEVYTQIEDHIETSCDSSDQCVATAIGVKPCGGPTKFIIHSNATDQTKLDELVADYNELNKQYNEATKAGSDCSVVTAPAVECVSGNCQEAETR